MERVRSVRSPRPATYLFGARALRDFGDGFVAVLLPVYLLALGFSPLQVGIIATASLFGSALLTIAVGFLGARHDLRWLLLAAASLMTATGVAMSLAQDYWLLLVIAFAGTINPSAGSVSVFVPLEHAALTREVTDAERTRMFARYSLIGGLAGAAGALAAALPEFTIAVGLERLTAIKWMFVLYSLMGIAGGLLYARLPKRMISSESAKAAALGPSRAIVLKLAALFSLDAFAGGFVVQSLLALWLFERCRSVARASRRILLLVGCAVGVLVSRRRMAVAACRPHQHHGVHPHSVEHCPPAGGVRIQLAPGACPAAHPGGALADGCADALFLCDGPCHRGGAGRGRELHIRAAQLGRSGQSRPCRCSPCCNLSLFAPRHLRHAEDRL